MHICKLSTVFSVNNQTDAQIKSENCHNLMKKVSYHHTCLCSVTSDVDRSSEKEGGKSEPFTTMNHSCCFTNHEHNSVPPKLCF